VDVVWIARKHPAMDPGRIAKERQKTVWMAVRQLEGADLYLAAVENLELRDRAVDRAIRSVRADLDAVRALLIGPRLWCL